MCVIAVKPAGQPLPNDDTLRTMWDNNPHGAGFMFAKGGAVHIRKGFMSFKEFQKALNGVKNAAALPLVLHFRISTGGGVCPQMTHPFPLSADHETLTAAKSSAAVGIAHNGVLPYPSTKTTSDTYEYITGQLQPLSLALPRWYKDRHAMQLVKNATDGSRLAILTGSGEIITTGTGWKEDGGLLYSNESYKPKLPKLWQPYGYGLHLADGYEDGWPTYEDFAVKDLMYLYSDDCAIRTDSGEWIDADGFAMDSDRNIYYFEEYEDAWIKLAAYEAYSHSGIPLQFDEAQSVCDYVCCY